MNDKQNPYNKEKNPSYEQILTDLNAEIEKVKNSNLSNEEKSQQIIALTTNNQKQFATTYQQLTSTWHLTTKFSKKLLPC